MAAPTRSLLDQPPEIVEKIMSFCSYDEIARVRLVCKAFDRICQSMLNKGFIAVDRYHAQCLRKVKAQLPRRESERRNHPLARHCDILTAIETRLSLLGMTFMKYVDTNLCCFIPGKVIDEIYRVLRYIQRTNSPPRAHEILQELRDISSMAMEHFDEKIVPVIKQRMINTPTRLTLSPQGAFGLPGPSSMFGSPPRPLPLPRGVRQDLCKIQQTIKQTNNIVAAMKKELNEYKSKATEQRKKLQEQEKLILEQNQVYSEQNTKISEQEGKINEINRKLLEYDQKFADLMAELIRSREESQVRERKSASRNGSDEDVIVLPTSSIDVDVDCTSSKDIEEQMMPPCGDKEILEDDVVKAENDPELVTDRFLDVNEGECGEHKFRKRKCDEMEILENRVSIKKTKL